MNSIKNKQLMQTIFAELSNGNDALFIDAMAQEMKWMWMGSGQWSKTFDGKHEILNTLWKAVRETLKPPYKTHAKNFIAEGEYVTVEAVGQNSTPDGRIYDNKYCWICRIVNGKIYELKEYMDTDLVTKTFTGQIVKIIGERFLVDFKMAKAILHFHSETTMQFKITEKDGKPQEEVETVAIKMTEIRPNLYMTTWKERNKNTITQLQDFTNRVVYSNWTTPDGEFINLEGTISPLTEGTE